MASPMVHSKNFKRLQSRKSHSWWWDSHINPKNSKWLAENLEEMDHRVKRMLKLIEEDADSFAKKAEMYYQKRPELISLVEEFYRMYRALAERYDNVTGELKRTILSDLQSQGSGISDIGSEPPSTLPSPASEQKHRSGHRAAGFDFFLGSGECSSDLRKGDDESSTLTDSEPESDDSYVINYSGILGNGNDSALSKRVTELETELREMKDRLQMQQEENGDGLFKELRNEESENLLGRIASYDEELKIANQRIQHFEEEVARLNLEINQYKSSESTVSVQPDFTSSMDENVNTGKSVLNSEETQASSLLDRLEIESQEANSTIGPVAEQLRITKDKLQRAEEEITDLKNQLKCNEQVAGKVHDLQDQLALARKEISTLNTKLKVEKREVSKLQERISRLKTSLSDRDHEIRDLKIAVSDAEQKIFPEKAQIKNEISRLLGERVSLEEQIKEGECRCRSFEDEIRMLKTEKSEAEERREIEISKLKEEASERDDLIKNLNKSLDALKSERDALNSQVVALEADITEMDKHLQQLHMEHVKLIASAEEAHKIADKLRSKVDDIEKEVERQKILITEGAEEKREAIRQLCFSIDHYRNRYNRLRKAVIEHKRFPVLAS